MHIPSSQNATPGSTELHDPAHPLKRAIVFTSSKGGPGKSTLCGATIAVLRRSRLVQNTTVRGRIVSAWDLDKTSGSTSRVYADRDPIVGMAQEDVTNRRNLRWLNAIETDADDVIWDVPGGRIDALTQNLAGGEKQLAALVKESGRRMVVVTVVGSSKPQLASVFDSVELFGTDVDHVILMNGFWGERDDFDVYFGIHLSDGTRRFGTVQEAAQSVRATELFVPPLLRLSFAACDHEDASFEAASAIPTLLTGFGKPELARIHAYNVRYWLDEIERCYAGTILDVTGDAPREIGTDTQQPNVFALTEPSAHG